MPTYTVQCGYNGAYGLTVTVEATTPEHACAAAVELANDNSAWRSHDGVSETYIDAIGEGEDDPWIDGFRSALPIPLAFTETAVVAGYAATRAGDLVSLVRRLLNKIRHSASSPSAATAADELRIEGLALLDAIDREDAYPACSTAPG